MPPRPSQWAIPLGVSFGAPIGLYVTFLFLGGFSFFQRQWVSLSCPARILYQLTIVSFFYAHRLNTLFWHDLDEPEYWGFASGPAIHILMPAAPYLILDLLAGNQVTPFTLTSGNESLYAWHVLPLRSVLEHEDRLQAAPAGYSNNITASESFKILKDDPGARLVISCKLCLCARPREPCICLRVRLIEPPLVHGVCYP